MRHFKVKLENGLTAHILAVSKAAFPETVKTDGDYTNFYEAHFGGKTWYMAKGCSAAPKEIVVWYPNGKMWFYYRTSNFKDALNDAIKDAWMFV